MLRIINSLCKNFAISSLDQLNLKELIEFRETKTGDNLLIYASRCGNLNLLRLLYENHQNGSNYFNYTNNDGKNALHESCQNEHLECVKFLIETAGVCINHLRKGDWTPLMLACTKNNLDVIKYLVEHKADLNQVNKDGWTAFHIAVREGNLSIVEYLLKVDQNLAHISKTKNGRTTLHTACLHGHLEIVKLLLNNETSLLNAKDSCGITPFMDALLADQLDIAQHLIYVYNIDLNLKDKLDNSCIHLMAQSGSINCLKSLFYKYYSKNNLLNELKSTLNIFNMTPLHSACKNNKDSILDYLLSELSQQTNNLNELINQKDKHGRSAIEISISLANNSPNKNACVSILNKYITN